MGRKSHKVEATQGGDMVIDLLVRHAAVPESGELLESYSRIYSGRPVGQVVQVDDPAQSPAAEPSQAPVDPVVEPEIEVPTAEYESLEEVVAAAGDDSDNDYDSPGATVTMDAIDVPTETMTLDAAEIDALLPVASPDVMQDVELPVATVEVQAASEVEQEEDGDFDENATVMMGAIDENTSGSSQEDASNRRKKKRRHR